MSSREKADTADVDCHEIYSDFPVELTEEQKGILDLSPAAHMAVLSAERPPAAPSSRTSAQRQRPFPGRPGRPRRIISEPLASGQHGSGGWTGSPQGGN